MNIFLITKIQNFIITNPVISQNEGTLEGVAANPLGSLFARLWQTLFILGGLAIVVYILWGGIDWLTSGGDSEKAKHARNKITNAIIGLFVLSASYAIILFLEWVFGFNVINVKWPSALK